VRSPTNGRPSTPFRNALRVFGLANADLRPKLTDEQEVLMHLADIAIRTF